MTDYKNTLEKIDEILVENLEMSLIGALAGEKPQSLLMRYAHTLAAIDELVHEALKADEDAPAEEPEEKDPTLDLSDVFGSMGPLADAIFGKGSNTQSDITSLLKGLFGDTKK